MRDVEPITDFGLIEIILDYLESTNKRNWILFSIGIYTGRRISDYINLRVKDVKDVDKLMMGNKKRKRNKRAVAMGDKLKESIRIYTEDMQGYQFLFPSRQTDENGAEKPLSYKQVYNIYTKIGKKFGIHISCHTLRKTHGLYIYLDSGFNPREAMEALDQKNIYSTMSYIGVGKLNTSKRQENMDFSRWGDVSEVIEKQSRKGY